jgi:putative transposase
MHHFDSLEQAQQLTTEWQWQHNNERPNTAIGGAPPKQLLQVT